MTKNKGKTTIQKQTGTIECRIVIRTSEQLSVESLFTQERSQTPRMIAIICRSIEQLLSSERPLHRQNELATYLCLQTELLGYHYSKGKGGNELPNTFLDRATYCLVFRGAT